ncbi:MAG: STAS domain-containing protein [Planctomycetota bacterium]
MTQHDDDRHVVAPEGTISMSNAAEFREELRAAIHDGALNITVDLTHVDMIDSTGLSMFVQCHQSLSEKGGTLEVTGLSDDIRALFTLMRLDQHLTIRNAA